MLFRSALANYAAADREAAAALAGMLEDPAWVVRRSAIEALGKLADKPARQALAARWQRADLPRERRAIEALFAPPAAHPLAPQ